MFSKLNPWPIVSRHCLALDDEGESLTNALWFFLLGAIPVALLMVFDFKLDKDIANVVISAASIFAGLLLNLLVLIYSVSGEFHKGETNSSERRQAILRKISEQTFSHISFGVLISVVVVFTALLNFVNSDWLKLVTTLAVLYGLGLLALTLLVILKRVHRLLEERFRSE